VSGQEKETVPRVIHSPLLGLQGGASERSTLFSLPWMKNFRKINKIKKFKKQKRMKMKMEGWGGGTCETKLNAYTMI
jgi:hypothetical protein